nr:MAG TPA: protein of unknown function (DUF2175) [Bacteriophage sp.]
MACEYCLRDSGHATRCPNNKIKIPNYTCCYCKEGIYPDDEYLESYDGEYIHRDCIPNIDFVIDWLGYETKYMKEDDAYDY